MDDDGPRRRAMTVADDAREVSAVSEAVGDGKHSGPADAQVARRLRPLRRRPARIARPARVRMRRRKPCVLLRLRLFGWNVRLLTRNTPGLESRSRPLPHRMSRQDRELDTGWTSGDRSAGWAD